MKTRTAAIKKKQQENCPDTGGHSSQWSATAHPIETSSRLCLPENKDITETEKATSSEDVMDVVDPLTDLCNGIRNKFGPLMNRLNEVKKALSQCADVEMGVDVNASILHSDIPDIKVGAAGGLKFALLQCRTAADEFLQMITQQQLCDVATYRNESPQKQISFPSSETPSMDQESFIHSVVDNLNLEFDSKSPAKAAMERLRSRPKRIIRMQMKPTAQQHVGVDVNDSFGSESFLSAAKLNVDYDRSFDLNPQADSPQPEKLPHRRTAYKEVELDEYEVQEEPIYLNNIKANGLKRVFRNYMYSRDKHLSIGWRSWRCVKKGKCNARIHDDYNGRVRRTIGQHTHPPMSDEIKLAKVMHSNVQLVNDTGTQPMQVAMELHKHFGDIPSAPNPRSIKRRIERIRQRTRNLETSKQALEAVSAKLNTMQGGAVLNDVASSAGYQSADTPSSSQHTNNVESDLNGIPNESLLLLSQNFPTNIGSNN